MKKILLAVLVLAFLAAPAFASTQNVKVSGDIKSTWLVRDQFDLGLPQSTDTNGDGTAEAKAGGQFYQNLLITQTRLRVDADLTDNVSATVRLINERPWGEIDVDGTDSGDVHVDHAYITLREFLYSPLTVQVGRMMLWYGNGLVIGNGTNNVTTHGGLNNVAEDLALDTQFDTVKLVLDYDPLTIDVFASKVDANRLTGSEDPTANTDDVDLYGINGNYKVGDAWNTVAESYFFSRIDDSVTTTAGAKSDRVYAPGVRASTNPIKGLNVQGEVAWQFGNKATTNTTGAARTDNQRREALAAQIISSYAIDHSSVAKWSPVIAGWATYLTGDTNGTTASNRTGIVDGNAEEWTAWDPLFEGQSGGTIYNTLFDYSNVMIGGTSLQVSPLEDILAKVTFSTLWLDQKIDTDRLGSTSAGNILQMRQPDGTLITPVVTTNKHVGNEIDVDLTYAYTEDVTFGFSAGWFMPGGLFDVENREVSGGLPTVGNNQIASQFLTSVGVNF